MAWKKELQQRIDPQPNLRRERLFGRRIICDEEGWSFRPLSSSAGRIDGYRYEEKGRQLTLGGEGQTEMDIVIPPHLTWDDATSTAIDDESAKRILFNITAAIQWSGFSVYFSYQCGDSDSDL